MSRTEAQTSKEQIKVILEHIRMTIEVKQEIGAAELTEKNTIDYMNSFLTSFGYLEEAYNKYKNLREEELLAIEEQTEVQKSDSVWNDVFVTKGYKVFGD